MKLEVIKSTANVSVYLFIQDSSETTGVGLTGLAYDTASLVCYYVRPGGSATEISLATQTVTGAHSDGGFVEVDSTNMPGIYRLDLPDAVCATGVGSVVVMLKGAADMTPCVLELALVNDTYTKASDTYALTALILEDTGTTLDGIVDAILVDTGTTIPGLIAALENVSTTDILDATVEGSYSLQDVLKIMASVLAGEVSGGGTTTITFRDLSDSLNRVVATVDAQGNRTNFVYTLT